ncbi:hypothetical protein F4774DRAFT_378214 [Daldinia eschscholtzii]|nr:hypothetical protein F4774DRAFT_378214 [Daldinia eschscholtzii]
MPTCLHACLHGYMATYLMFAGARFLPYRLCPVSRGPLLIDVAVMNPTMWCMSVFVWRFLNAWHTICGRDITLYYTREI